MEKVCLTITTVVTDTYKTAITGTKSVLGIEDSIISMYKYCCFQRTVFPNWGSFFFSCWCLHIACFIQDPYFYHFNQHNTRSWFKPDGADKSEIFVIDFWERQKFPCWILYALLMLFKPVQRWFIVQRNCVAYHTNFIFPSSDLNQTWGCSTDTVQEET